MSSLQAFRVSMIAFGITLLCFPSECSAQVATPQAVDRETQSENSDWPPAWIEGVWKVELVEELLNGEPTDKNFVFADYVLFTSGYRFSLYGGKRLTAARMLGQKRHGESLHCLFKMTRDRPAMQTKFTQMGDSTGDSIEYVSYLIMPRAGRFRFKRHLTRMKNQADFVKQIQAAGPGVVSSDDSTLATEVIEAWIEKNKPIATDQ